MTLKYTEVEGYDADAVAEASRRYDARTGFNWQHPEGGCTRLEYPPYLPAVTGYRVPRPGAETSAMTLEILAWNERWVGAR